MRWLSFVIPAYNCEKYLEHGFESLRNCGLEEHEYDIVYINDASTDKTLERLHVLSQTYRNVRIVDQPKGGPATARNNGLKAASGEYIWFVDADDKIEKDFARRLLPYMQAGYELIAFNYKKVFYDHVQDYNAFAQEAECAGIDYLERKYHGLYLWDKVFKKSAITEFFIDDTYHIEDFYFDYVNIIKMKSVVCIPECGYYYMQWENNSISKKRDLASVTKANDDAFIVYSSLARRKIIDDERAMRLQQLVLSHGLAGHFFTMMNESPVGMICNYIERYRQADLYPVAYTDEKRKNLFIWLVNHRSMFVGFLKIKQFI